MSLQALSVFLSLLFISSVSAAPSTALTHYGNGEVPEVSSNSLAKIKEIIENEVASHVVKAYLGVAPEYAADSCKQIAELKPHYDSGYYWIQGKSGPVGVYCEMNPQKFEQTGGWMKIADIDMRRNRSHCPIGLKYDFVEDHHLCRKQSLGPGCSFTTFPVQGVKYSKVCGKVIGYQYYQPNGFGPSRSTPGIDQIYADGVSITHGSPRQHVWTYTAAISESDVYHHTACPCLDFSRSFTGKIPSFVGNDYYCETGNRNIYEQQYYFSDPLWDGEGCTGGNMCCDRGGPWFCKDIERETFDDIELRVCTNNNSEDEDTPLEQIELYVQ